jgi:hypothetical protein
MKNFTKIIFALAALFATACTTDITDNLSVNLGEQTTLTLSLEESRTQLGSAVAGLYPVTWSENDCISVNGVASSAIVIAENKSTATFTFGGALTYPYAVAYPAAAEGKVLFAAEQSHTDGSFATGAAAMYGYANDAGALTLNHLTGILKIGVVGSKTLSHAQISTVDRTPIAGEFTLDFTTGEVAATSASKEIIDYSFGEGLALTSTEQYLHIAVPAGVYNELYVTLYDTEGGVMYATVKANDEKPLTAGKVRQFTNAINYTPSESIFVIKDYASLKEFAKQIGSLTKDAVFVADVDVPADDPWVSINDSLYTHTVRGNGYAIKGLTKPLFDTTAANFKGLHLKDVKIVETKNPTIGALARYVKSLTAVVENCSAVGSFTINATEVPVPETPSSVNSWAGGLIGRSATLGAMTGLYTDVDIYADGHIPTKFAIGGCVGSTDGAINNSTNLGTLTYNCTEATNSCTVYIGGVCMECVGMENCVNGSKDDATGATGAITISGIVGGAGAIGGIADMTMGVVTNCHNYGCITASATSYGNHTLFIGGIVRMSNDHTSVYTNCTNHGDILISGLNDEKLYYKIGGIISKDNYGCEFNSCDNYGDITVDSAVKAYRAFAGGFTSSLETTVNACKFTFNNCNNYGNINIGGTYTSYSYIGGLVSSVHKEAKLICTDCTNSGEVKFIGSLSSYLRMGGFLGYAEHVPTTPQFVNCTNNGAVKISSDATVGAESDIGGMVGIIAGNKTDGVENIATLSLRNCSNLEGGDIEVACTAPFKFNIGGILGRLGNSYATISLHEEILNKGDITLSGSVKECGIGGIFGFFLHKFGYVTKEHNLINYGKITFSGTVSGGRCLIGGIIGATDSNMNGGGGLNPINLGDIECTGTIDTSKANHVGGIVGLMASTSGKVNNSQCFCNIKAIGYPNVGIATGTPRNTNNLVYKCKAGGTITQNTRYEEAEDGSGDQVTVPQTVVITSDNYFEHVYGTTQTKSDVDSDAFTLLNSADEITLR